MAMINGEDKEAQLFTVTNSGPRFHTYLKIAVEIGGLPAAYCCLVQSSAPNSVGQKVQKLWTTGY